MSCIICGSKKKLSSSIVKHRYKECGLDNVILHGVKESRCEDCGEVFRNYGDLGELHKLIAKFLIKKSDLFNGNEIRFLRKLLGFSGAAFAQLVGYEPEHLSRIESGKTAVQPIFDHLVRELVAKKIPDRDYDLQDLFLNGKGMKIEWLEFSLKGKEWSISDHSA